MTASSFDPLVLKLCEQVTAKRPRAVIDKILEKGFVTTEDLQTMGYDHPPRAARDVRENGVPLETFKVKSERTGRMIAAYKFGDVSNIKAGRIGGRVAFSKQFRNELIERYGERDCITGAKLESRYLQIDHRIPYEVAGDTAIDELEPSEFMLLDASSQRAKSWSCENCENWNSERDVDVCRECFWAYPENYTHVALRKTRRLDVVWSDKEVVIFEELRKEAEAKKMEIREFIKAIVSQRYSKK